MNDSTPTPRKLLRITLAGQVDHVRGTLHRLHVLYPDGVPAENGVLLLVFEVPMRATERTTARNGAGTQQIEFVREFEATPATQGTWGITAMIRNKPSASASLEAYAQPNGEVTLVEIDNGTFPVRALGKVAPHNLDGNAPIDENALTTLLNVLTTEHTTPNVAPIQSPMQKKAGRKPTKHYDEAARRLKNGETFDAVRAWCFAEMGIAKSTKADRTNFAQRVKSRGYVTSP